MAVRAITIDELEGLQIDEASGQLFWRGKAVVVERRINLAGYQIALATIGAVGALLAGLHPFGQSLGWW